VTLDVAEQQGAIIYRVQDTGCGMDYEIKRKVFTTFFTTKGMGGTGLGLLVTRKIVQEHGGRIEVESEPGQGSTFRLIFPRHRLPQLPEGSGDRYEVTDGAR
jgi:signal transduction histidine kinase